MSTTEASPGAALALLALLGTGEACGDKGGGRVDAACPGSVWYADVDGDGSGDDAGRLSACDAPAGYVAEGGDCDDSDGSVRPGGLDACENGLDEDCDGGDVACVDLAYPWPAGELTGVSGYGPPVASLPTGGIVVTGDTPNGSTPAMVYVWTGPVEGEQALADGASRVLAGDADDRGFGLALAAVGTEGGVAVYSAGSDRAVRVYGPTGDEPTLTWRGDFVSSVDRYLQSGDLTGDGVDELIIPQIDPEGGPHPDDVVYLVDAGRQGEVAVGEEDARVWLEGYPSGAGFRADSIDDTDGDGLRELLLNTGLGAAILRGPIVGDVSQADADVVIDLLPDPAYPPDRYNGFDGGGGVGDVDGDGRGEVAFASYLSINVVSPVTDGTMRIEDAPIQIPCDPDFVCISSTLVLGLELEGDDRSDLAVEVVPYEGGTSVIWLLHGPLAGNTGWPAGTQILAGDNQGVELMTLCDLDGDLVPDVVIEANPILGEQVDQLFILPGALLLPSGA